MGRLDGRRSVAGHLGEKLFVCMHHITCSTRIFPVYWKGFRLTSKNHTMNILNLLFFQDGCRAPVQCSFTDVLQVATHYANLTFEVVDAVGSGSECLDGVYWGGMRPR